ncbi:hypothetical protein [Tropicibacter naphthalenivorans]|uniref:Peptidase M23 n=1 Tax=Tropicibacter naphthalenivorans TaxID=441103 RepID=A0A0P1GGL2_9RHOB|nr:hypothetical protein [Tropicibacter naphthalenivorans]CUH75323.1 hypothetical protein TRN7648_00380 [Tropicibacter naphthalenivorans]SMC45076.1 hypothetical protein SAMN04488093_101499 [Tropicibacter naphthalenivorans]
MKTVGLILAGVVAAGPALAHEGAHLHPHGSGSWVSVVVALGLVSVAALVAWGRK